MLKLKSFKLLTISILAASSALMAEDAKKSMCPIPAGVQPQSNGQSARIAGFSLSALELTHGEWSAVRVWALTRGYDFGPGIGETSEHPVSAISWYDAVKFCNAASERAGRTPVYRVGNEVFRVGMSDNVTADWAANGYRLPTEAEWEYACRAGTTTSYYWGDHPYGARDNPYAWHVNSDSVGDEVSPHPVGAKKPNTFGLYDMSGNIVEWCWDWYAPTLDLKVQDNPHGPDQGRWRMLRGGSVAMDSMIDSSYRHFVYPFFTMFDIGLRVASSDPKCPAIAADRAADRAAAPTQPTRALTDPDAKAAAERLFALIDLSRPGLETVAAHLKAGRYAEALAAYRDYFIAAQRAIPLQGKTGFGKRPEPEEVTAAMGIKGHAAFYRPLTPDGSVGLPFPTKKLLAEWAATKDPALLKQALYLMAQFALYAKADFLTLDNVGRAGMNSFNKPLTWDWGMGFNDHSQLGTLRQIAHLLPEDGAVAVPPLELAQLLAFAATDSISLNIKDPRECNSNQAYHVATMLMELGRYLPEFQDASLWFAEGKRRFTYNASRSVLADGGDLEQALRYNYAMPDAIHGLTEMFGQEIPVWLQKLHQVGIQRHRLFAGVILPTGGKPTTGAYGVYAPPASIYHDSKAQEVHKKRQAGGVSQYLADYPDPLLQAVYGTLLGANKAVNAPAFTSVAFPYSGYYALRDGWELTSRYLWFMAQRPGQGHGVENVNSVEVVAFGRMLLTSGGASSYGSPSFVIPEQLPIIKQIDEYRHNSYSRNTVLVDGKTQQRRISGRFTRSTPYPEPINQRWHTSAHFDLVDGVYNDGYGEEGDAPIIAEHRRRVLFLRDAGLWLITDRMTADAPHTYAALWNFLPVFPLVHGQGTAGGFTDDQVTVQPERQAFGTRDPNGPNLFLYQAAAVPVSYQRFCGQINPARGWLAPGIGGPRYPKTDIWSSWPGAAGVSQLITAVCPSPQAESPVLAVENLSKEDIAGMKIMLRDGGMLTWLSASKQTELNAGPVAVSGEALLVFTDAKGGVRGLTIGCREITIAGTAQKVSGPDFEFAVDGQRLAEVQPIQVPDGFAWKETPTGIMPDYHPRAKGEAK